MGGQQPARRQGFDPLSGFFLPRSCVWMDCRGGGMGITPACPSNLPTVAVGCAPTASQYLHQCFAN